MLRDTIVSFSDVPAPEMPHSQPYATVLESRFSTIDVTSLACRDLADRAKPRASSLSQLVRKLSAFARFNSDEVGALESLSRRSRLYRREQILIHEGSPSDSIYLIVTGLACRYKMLANGRRQILGYLIPGDLCDFHFTIANQPDHSVVVVTESSAARISIKMFTEVIERYPNIAQAMTLSTLGDVAVLREWLLNVGQRNAMQKLSHFFCEMANRLEAIGGIGIDGSFELPVNQVILADTLGLTPVHINRTLQQLRSMGLINFCHRRLKILDRDRLSEIGDFNSTYLNSRVATG